MSSHDPLGKSASFDIDREVKFDSVKHLVIAQCKTHLVNRCIA